VVVVDFWAYSCINCLRAMPYVNAWYRHYKDAGLVVLGVHSPEFAFEKDIANVRAAVKQFDIQYPVALDNEMAIWKAFNNKFWPAHYFVDAKGQIRGHHFGEGKYAKSEREIRRLLTKPARRICPIRSTMPRGKVLARQQIPRTWRHRKRMSATRARKTSFRRRIRT
jgi:thiol-disulfide isomerase/thioredoxin